MQEFTDYANSHGFNVVNPQLDGRVHRFPRDGKSSKKNCWYIGFVNYSTKSGKKYVYAEIGDWKTGEKYELKPEGKEYSKEDKAVVARQIAEAAEIQKREKAERQEKTALLAKEVWEKASAKNSDCQYLKTKKISNLYGAKSQLEDEGRTLFVPCQDIDGKLWGIQKIFPDGKKRFMFGQKIKGTFHQIGELGEVIYICEGFATGASIHEATGEFVVCAFNAGNLLEVSKVWARKSQKKIVICADDDKTTEGNPGRTKATEAAAAVSGTVIFPKLSDNKLSDFNDVHVTLGLEELKKQLTPDDVPRETGFIPLGFDETAHYFFSKETKTVSKLTSFSDVQCFGLMNRVYWETLFPGKKGGIDWPAVKDYLIGLSKACGIYRPSLVRGSGVWIDGGKVVVNTGKTLICEKDLKLKHFYIQTQNSIPDINPNPLTITETEYLRSACEELHWREPRYGHLLAGWLAVARIAGALPVRPHIWLTGGSGTGKSTVMDRIIRPCLGAGKIYVQGGSTEAGIRQSVKADAVPLIFDEFETLDNTGQRVQTIIELLRQTWSFTDGAVIKGSAGGTAERYQLSFAALVSSIRVVLTNDADRSRFTVMELAPHGNDREHWTKFKEILKKLDEEYGERLFARSVKMIPVILQNYEIFCDELSGVISQRFGQQHGMLLAAWYSLYSDKPVSRSVAKEVISDMGFIVDKDELTSTDELDCIEAIKTVKLSFVDQQGHRRDSTIVEILDKTGNIPHEWLKTFGILIDNEQDIATFANHHSALKKYIFGEIGGKRWVDCYRETLLRLPGAKPCNSQIWDGTEKKNSKAFSIPLKYLK